MVNKAELAVALDSQSNKIYQQIGQQINSMMDQLLPKIDDISKKLQMHIEEQNALNTEFERRIKKLEQNAGTGAAPTYASVVKRTVTELAAREVRETNVVINGLPESTVIDRAERMSDEKRSALGVLQHLNPGLSDDDISSVFRTGKKREDRPRLAIVKLRNAEIRADILRKARQSQESIAGGIKVRPDLTKTEREQENEFFGRLKEAKEANPDKVFRVMGPPGNRRFVIEKAKPAMAQ